MAVSVFGRPLAQPGSSAGACCADAAPTAHSAANATNVRNSSCRLLVRVAGSTRSGCCVAALAQSMCRVGGEGPRQDGTGPLKGAKRRAHMRPMLLPLVSLLLHAWIAWRLVPDLGAPVVGGAARAPRAVGAHGAARPGLRRAAGRGRFVQVASRIGLVAIGLFSSLLVLTLLRDLGLLLLSLVDRVEPGVAGRWQSACRRGGQRAGGRRGSPCSPPPGASSMRGGRRPVRRVDVPIAGLPAGLHGFTIVQLSDLHVGPTIRRPYVERVVAAVNAPRRRPGGDHRRPGRRLRARARAARRAAGGPAFARRHLLRHRQPRVLLGRRRLGRRAAPARPHGARERARGDPARRGDAGRWPA